MLPKVNPLLQPILDNVRIKLFQLDMLAIEAKEILDPDFSEEEAFVDLKQAVQDARKLEQSIKEDSLLKNSENDTETYINVVKETANTYNLAIEELCRKLNKRIEDALLVSSKEQ